MSTGQIEVYRKEIFDFLRTVSIKFEPFSYTLGRAYMEEHGYTDFNDVWNPYFQNLCGDYAYYDTPIYVYAIEDNQEHILTKEFLATHPKTAAMYRIPNTEYFTLCKKYPKQEGLIKSIIYPAKDIQTVIAAPNLSVLAYDANILHIDERESLISELESFLSMVNTRWWVPEYCYENLYHVSFWMLLWQTLPNVLLAKRVDNIHTPAVHPFHIWEYLTSHGIGDYRDILSSNQAKWLYRNLPWVLKNKGKNNTLIELAKHLLTEMRVHMGGVTIKPNTYDSIDDCLPTPELVVNQIETDAILSQMTLPQLLNKIEAAKLIPATDADERVEIATTLATTEKDKLKTKYVEFVRKNTDTKWERLLVEFLFDSFMYRFINNDLQYKLKYTDSVMGGGYSLSVEDSVALLYYALHRQFGTEVTYLPNSVSTRICYHRTRPNVNTLPKSFHILGEKYYIKSYVDVEGMTDRIPYYPRMFLSHDEYLDFIASQFQCILLDVVNVHSSGHRLYHEAMTYLYGHLLVNKRHEPISFGPDVTTYNVLRSRNLDLEAIISYYDSTIDLKENYRILSDTLMSTLFPLANSRFTSLIGVSSYEKKIYEGLRSLFVQLCSYNISFLDTDRDYQEYFGIPAMLEHIEARTSKGNTHLYLTGTYDVINRPVGTRPISPVPIGMEANNISPASLFTSSMEIDIRKDIDLGARKATATIWAPTGISMSIINPATP